VCVAYHLKSYVVDTSDVCVSDVFMSQKCTASTCRVCIVHDIFKYVLFVFVVIEDFWDSVSTQPSCLVCKMVFASETKRDTHVKYSVSVCYS
jgi:hypothetical protein